MDMDFDLGQQAEIKLNQIMQFMEGSKQQLLGIIGSVLVTEINESFVTAQDPWGNIWRPLKVRDGNPLRDTGRLKNSINYQLYQDYVEIGTNLIYAPLHQFGGTITPKKAKFLRFFAGGKPVFASKVYVPARPYLPINQAGQVFMPDAWEQSILRGIKTFIEGAI